MKVCLILIAATASCVAQAPAGWRPSGRLLLLPARLEEPTTTNNSTQSDEKESARILDSGEYYVLLEDGRLQMVKYTTAALKEESAAAEPKAQEAQYPFYQKPQQFPGSAPAGSSASYLQAQQAQQPQSPFYQQPQQFSGSAPAGSSAYYLQAQQPERNQYTASQQTKQPQSEKYTNPSAASVSSQQTNPESFAKFQLEYVQFPLPGSQFAQTKLAYTVPQTEGQAEAVDKKEGTKEPSGYEANVQYRDVKPISAPIYAHNPAPLVRILKK